MTDENNKKTERTGKKIGLRLVLLIITLIILSYVYYLFIEFGTYPIIALIVVLFIFLVTLGLTFRRNKKSLYSRMFPDKKRKTSFNKSTSEKEINEEKEFKQLQPRVIKPVNLEFNYHKHIILKCERCGNIIPNFVKKCPFCKKTISY
jgi:flagellar basal body-associated protein FliL